VTVKKRSNVLKASKSRISRKGSEAYSTVRSCGDCDQELPQLKRSPWRTSSVIGIPRRLRRGSRIRAIERSHRVLPAAHGVRVAAQRHDRVLVTGELGDEADFDALRLKR
jgi:polyribonucleotide nucleotidyltransferase